MESSYKRLFEQLQNPEINASTKLDVIEEITKKSKENVKALVSETTSSASVLVRLSNFWGKQSLRFKITAGFALIAPLLVLSLLTHILLFSFLCVQAILLYTVGSLLLDDDFKNRDKNQSKIESVFDHLSQMFEALLGALTTLGETLRQKEQFLTQTTEKLNVTQEAYAKTSKELSSTSDKLGCTEAGFKQLQEELEITTAHFNKKIDNLTEIGEKQEAALQHALDLAKSLNSIISNHLQSASNPFFKEALDGCAEKIEHKIEQKVSPIGALLNDMAQRMEDLHSEIKELKKTSLEKESGVLTGPGFFSVATEITDDFLRLSVGL